MNRSVQKYFVAILPPAGISTEARKLQTQLSEQYQTKGALRSPPHITLHMPFNWKVGKEHDLITMLSGFMAHVKPFLVSLKGYGSFAPRVIYLNVIPSNDLVKFQQELTRFCRISLNLLNATPRDLPYHPHLTLAFRDLKKQEFVKAWDDCKSRQYEAEFAVTTIHLLRHEGNEWKARHAFDMDAANPE
jgi:2'-5' RNA ligase